MVWIAWAALAVALGALGYGWKLSYEVAAARGRLDRYNKALYDANDEIARLREELAQGLAAARVAGLKTRGNATFDAQMTVREAGVLHAQAPEVLGAFHVGGCSHCAVEPDETLAQVGARSGVAVDALVAALNQLLEQPDGPDARNGRGLDLKPSRTSNVQVEW